MSSLSSDDAVLSGIRVIECAEGVAGPYCARLLADAGADVIKVEPPWGDETRRRGPFPGDGPDPNWSGLYLHLNSNKRGITTDVRDRRGREIVVELLSKADVLVLGHSPAVLDELHLYRTDLQDMNPRLIVTAITPYGIVGPFRDHRGDELTAVNHGGLAHGTPGIPDIIAGWEKEPPLRANTFLSGTTAAIQASVAIMMALLNRSFTGQGDQIDVSVHSAVTVIMSLDASHGVYLEPNPREPRVFGIQPNVIMPCKDGYVLIVAFLPDNWESLKDIMGRPEWAESDVFKNEFERARNWDALEPLLLEWTMRYTGQEILAMARAKGLPCFPLYTVGQMMESEQMAARDYWLHVNHATKGRIKLPGYPVHMAASPWRFRRPAPRLGEHTVEVLETELGYSPADVNLMRGAGII